MRWAVIGQTVVKRGAIAPAQAEFLHLHRLLGNDAVHDMAVPTLEELRAAIDIVESLLKNLYELPEIAADLKAARDRRIAKANKP